jgi:hypothetical protein
MITQTHWNFDVADDGLLDERVKVFHEPASSDDWLATAGGNDGMLTAAGNTPLEAITGLVETLRELADAIERGIIPRIEMTTTAV